MEADRTKLFAGEAWFDPIEGAIRDRVHGFIQELLEQELTAALGRTRHERAEWSRQSLAPRLRHLRTVSALMP